MLLDDVVDILQLIKRWLSSHHRSSKETETKLQSSHGILRIQCLRGLSDSGPYPTNTTRLPGSQFMFRKVYVYDLMDSSASNFINLPYKV